MIKKLIFLLLLTISFQVHAQQNNSKQAILKALEKVRSDWNKGDLEAFMQGYWKSDSVLFVGSNGPTYGWQKTLDNYKKDYPNKAAMGTLIFGIKKVELLTADQAFVLGSWHVKQAKAEFKGYFTLLLRKINGAWKIVVDHSS
jgi:ketosteroid isomerase-like protein